MTSLDNISLPALSIASFAQWHNDIDHYKLPTFIPNDYLFEKHADKGRNKAEIYAWAVRDVMSKFTGKPKIELSEDVFILKQAYEKELGTYNPAKFV